MESMIDSISTPKLNEIKNFLDNHTPWGNIHKVFNVIQSVETSPKVDLNKIKWDTINYDLPGNLLCRELYYDEVFIESLKLERELCLKNMGEGERDFILYSYNRKAEIKVDSYIDILHMKIIKCFYIDTTEGYPSSISKLTIRKSFDAWYKEFSKPRIIWYEIRLNAKYHDSLPFPPEREEFINCLQKNCRYNGIYLDWHGETALRNISIQESKFIRRYNLNQRYMDWLKETDHPLASEKVFLEELNHNCQKAIDKYIERRKNNVVVLNSLSEDNYKANKKQQQIIQNRLDEINLNPTEVPDKTETKSDSSNLSIKGIVNNFDKVEIIKIYNHFKNHLVDKKHLTESELIEYMISAFEKKEIPQTLFQLINCRSRQNIVRVFYKYYKEIAGKPFGKQKEYSALLGNYFEGFNTVNVSTNFSK